MDERIETLTRSPLPALVHAAVGVVRGEELASRVFGGEEESLEGRGHLTFRARDRIEEPQDLLYVSGERFARAVRLDDEERRELFGMEQTQGDDVEPEVLGDERDAAPERGGGGVGEPLPERVELVGRSTTSIAARPGERGSSTAQKSSRSAPKASVASQLAIRRAAGLAAPPWITAPSWSPRGRPLIDAGNVIARM